MIRQTVLNFKLERTDETLTAHGGLALMGEYNHRLGLQALADKHLPAPGSNRGYAPSVFVSSLVLMLQGGGRSLEDLRELVRESALMQLIGDARIPDPDTTGDWCRRMGVDQNGQSGLAGLGRVRDALTARLLSQEARIDYTLDADATLLEAEKRDAAWTYKKVQGYMPMLGFLFETPICLVDEFREGNVSPGSGQANFYRMCKERMPQGKQIARYRADSASYVAELINQLESDGVKWAITADQDVAVKKLIQAIPEEAWKEPKVGCGYQIAEGVHTMNKTAQAFRLVLKREVRYRQDLFEEQEGRYFYHAVANNFKEKEKDAYEVLTWHNQRGSAENFNKELKNGFGMEQMPCGQSHANAVFFRIGVIAYNLFIGFKRALCPEEWQNHTIATIRWKMIQVAGRIVHHAGQVILRLAMDSPMLLCFEQMRRRCYGLSFAT